MPSLPPVLPIERAVMPDGWRLAYRRVRGGPAPVLLVHGFPCTSLLWARVMAPLAEAGLDVVAVDLAGYGDSELPSDGCFDLASLGAHLLALADQLGWGQVTIAAHDLGASVSLELAIRHPERVAGLFLMNHVIPVDGGDFAGWTPDEEADVFAYAVEQGHHAAALLARLPTPEARREYVEAFYTERGWCPPEAFARPALDLLVAPFEDRERLRASFHDYEIAAGVRPACHPERLGEPVPRPVAVLLGTHDRTLVPDAVRRCRAAYPHLLDVTLAPGAGHFLPWEQPQTVVDALVAFVARTVGRPDGPGR